MDFNKIPTDAEGFRDFSINFMAEGGTFGILRGLDDNDIEALYSVGTALYSHEKYEKAHEVFSYLCRNDHLKKRNWMGLGAVCQMQKKYGSAVKAYAFAILIDTTDPWPHLYVGDCYFHDHSRKEARNALNAALHFANGKKEYAELIKRADFLLGTLSKTSKKKERVP